MNAWHTFNCENCKRKIGYTDDRDIIVGGMFIRQPRTNLVCSNSNCGQTKVFRSPEQGKFLRFVSDPEIKKIISGEMDVKDLFFKPKKI